MGHFEGIDPFTVQENMDIEATAPATAFQVWAQTRKKLPWTSQDRRTENHNGTRRSYVSLLSYRRLG